MKLIKESNVAETVMVTAALIKLEPLIQIAKALFIVNLFFDYDTQNGILRTKLDYVTTY